MAGKGACWVSLMYSTLLLVALYGDTCSLPAVVLIERRDESSEANTWHTPMPFQYLNTSATTAICVANFSVTFSDIIERHSRIQKSSL